MTYGLLVFALCFRGAAQNVEPQTVESPEELARREANLYDVVDLHLNNWPQTTRPKISAQIEEGPLEELRNGMRLRHDSIRDELMMRYGRNFPDRFASETFQPQLVEAFDELGRPKALYFYTNGVVKDFADADAGVEETAPGPTAFDLEVFQLKGSLESESSVARDPSDWQGCRYELRWHSILLRYFLFSESCYDVELDQASGEFHKSKTVKYARWAHLIEPRDNVRRVDESLTAYHERQWADVASQNPLQCPGGKKGGQAKLYCFWREDLMSTSYVEKLVSREGRVAAEALLCELPEKLKCGSSKACSHRLIWRQQRFDPRQIWSSDLVYNAKLNPQKGLRFATRRWGVKLEVEPFRALDHRRDEKLSVPVTPGRISVPVQGSQRGVQSMECRWLP